MTNKSYALYVIYKDGSKRMIGKKNRLEFIDRALMESTVSKENLLFDLLTLYPDLRRKPVKKVQIEYQSRGKTRVLDTVHQGDKALLDFEIIFQKSLAHIENPIFHQKIISPYDDNKPYPLSQMARILSIYRERKPYDSEEYNDYYFTKRRFLETYLLNKDKTSVNYLHLRRAFMALKQIENKDITLENYGNISNLHFDFTRHPSDQERLDYLYATLEAIPYEKRKTPTGDYEIDISTGEVTRLNDDNDVEVDDTDYSMLYDEGLSAKEKEYAKERFESLPKKLQLRYTRDVK